MGVEPTRRLVLAAIQPLPLNGLSVSPSINKIATIDSQDKTIFILTVAVSPLTTYPVSKADSQKRRRANKITLSRVWRFVKFMKVCRGGDWVDETRGNFEERHTLLRRILSIYFLR